MRVTYLRTTSLKTTWWTPQWMSPRPGRTRGRTGRRTRRRRLREDVAPPGRTAGTEGRKDSRTGRPEHGPADHLLDRHRPDPRRARPARLRRLAVLGHQLGRRSGTSARSPAQLQEDWARARQGLRQVRPEGEASRADPDPEVRQGVRRPGARGHRQGDVLDKGPSVTSRTPPDAGQVGNYALAGAPGHPRRAAAAHARPAAGRQGDRGDRAKFTYTYRLDTNPNDLVIPFTGTWVLDPVPHNPDPAGCSRPRRSPASG